MKIHSYSFFGQKVAIIFNSSSWDVPYVYFRFIKKKEDGTWEKPSAKEGKNLKLGLLELISIIDTLNGNRMSWRTVHKFNGKTTSIAIKIEGDSFHFMVANYRKRFSRYEKILFKMLLEHVLQEKIIYSTVPLQGNSQIQNLSSDTIDSSPISISQKEALLNTSYSSDKDIQRFSSERTSSTTSYKAPITETSSNFSKEDHSLFVTSKDSSSLDDLSPDVLLPSLKLSNINPQEWFSQLERQDEYCLIPADIIAKREKAIAVEFFNESRLWIPRSLIREDPVLGSDKIWVKEWFIQKKLEDIFP